MDFGRPYKLYLPLACNQFFQELLTIVSSSLNNKSGTYSQIKLGLQVNWDEAYRLMNGKREYTLSFMYLLNGWYYLSVAQICFHTCVCGWIGALYDYYTVYFKNKNGPFLGIRHGDELDIVVDFDNKTICMQEHVVD